MLHPAPRTAPPETWRTPRIAGSAERASPGQEEPSPPTRVSADVAAKPVEPPPARRGAPGEAAAPPSQGAPTSEREATGSSPRAVTVERVPMTSEAVPPGSNSPGETVIVRPMPPKPRRADASEGGERSPLSGSGGAGNSENGSGVLSLSPVEEAGGAGPSSLFRVEVGAPESRQESERLAAELRENGFSATVVAEGGLYRVQVGAFRSRQNAERLASDLAGKGYAATVTAGAGD